MKYHLLCTLLVPATLFLSGCEKPSDPAAAQSDVTPEEAQAIAKEAYLYGFPMVTNYKTMWNYAVDKDNPEYKGPFNEVSCEARLFTPDDKAVVTPNADTPYCMFWMDLRAEPLVLSVPKMEGERYYSFQLIDLYTHNFAYVGNLTTGNEAGHYLLAGPGWDGEKPEGITDVIRSETDVIFNVTRTQLFGPDDLEKVQTIQGQYKLEPLSAFLGEEAPAASAKPDFPEWVEGSQFDERFLLYLDFIMDLLEKPGQGEDALWQDLARLGVGPGNTFRLDALPDETVQALKAGVKEGFAEIEAFIASNASDPLASGKLFGTREFLNESARENFGLDRPDILRSAGAQAGLYGNSAKEAIYPTYFTDADHDWGCLRVWAWGGSVTLNWLSTLPEVDMTKVVCTGHSRGGQTAALMGMMDERVAVVAPNAGGSITTGCHRVGNESRRIKNKMNSNNAYWFHPNLIPFGDQETRLPFDLHFIKAAVAPRAWFNANGLTDKLNVEGSMVTWRAARVVYDWLGVKERCGQWYRDGGHDQGARDWRALADFADFADFIFYEKPFPDPEAFYQEPWPDIPLHYTWKAPR